MLLKAFQIKNYKSFIDSGRCSVQNGVTILAGQNESGKTNILSALEKLNLKEPVFLEDEYSFSDTSVSPEILYWFDLSMEEINELNESIPKVNIDHEIIVQVQNKKRTISYTNNYTVEEDDEDEDEEVSDNSTQIVAQLELLLPKFVLYKTLENDIPDSFVAKDITSLAVKRLESYLNTDFKNIFDTTNHQIQRRLTQKLSTTITGDFASKYRQKDVELEFDINAATISMYVYDKESANGRKGYPFKLSQRSTGLKWYLNFYIALKGEDLKPGDIVLVDEPGMYLHPKAQLEMRQILNAESANNQIIYTTHSPYLIDTDNISQLRLVEKHSVNNEQGYNEISEIKEKVHHSKSADTLKPIVDAIGYSLGSELNLHEHKVIICEGVSDYYYLKALELLLNQSLECKITHANGCNNIGRIASLFLGLGISDVFALVDSDAAGAKERKKLIRDGVFDEGCIFTTHEQENEGKTIEDVFNRDSYLKEIMEYTEADIKKADVLLSKEVAKQVNGAKFALAKSLYEKARAKTISTDILLEKEAQGLFDKLKTAINRVDKIE